MGSGDNKAALHHFEQAEAALGENEENEEHDPAALIARI
jgi:hypothetical protein